MIETDKEYVWLVWFGFEEEICSEYSFSLNDHRNQAYQQRHHCNTLLVNCHHELIMMVMIIMIIMIIIMMIERKVRLGAMAGGILPRAASIVPAISHYHFSSSVLSSSQTLNASMCSIGPLCVPQFFS